MNCGFSGCRSTRVIALLLVLAVPFLSTMARRGWFLSPSDHGHYLIDASKAKVAHGPILHDPLPLGTVVVPVPSQPRMRVERYLEPTSSLSLYSLGVTISLQHRLPPIFSSSSNTAPSPRQVTIRTVPGFTTIWDYFPGLNAFSNERKKNTSSETRRPGLS
jgi:hypothetical protein